MSMLIHTISLPEIDLRQHSWCVRHSYLCEAKFTGRGIPAKQCTPGRAPSAPEDQADKHLMNRTSGAPLTNCILPSYLAPNSSDFLISRSPRFVHSTGPVCRPNGRASHWLVTKSNPAFKRQANANGHLITHSLLYPYHSTLS